MDLILDANGSFSWVQGPYTAPVISTGATRPTLDEPHPIHGSSPQNPESEEVPVKVEESLQPTRSVRSRRPALGSRPGGLGLHPVRRRQTGRSPPHRSDW